MKRNRTLWGMPVVLAVMAVGLLGTVSCTRVQSAAQIGGTEPATWVYVVTSNESRTGIFRCEVTEGQQPRCVRAVMQYEGGAQ